MRQVTIPVPGGTLVALVVVVVNPSGQVIMLQTPITVNLVVRLLRLAPESCRGMAVPVAMVMAQALPRTLLPLVAVAGVVVATTELVGLAVLVLLVAVVALAVVVLFKLNGLTPKSNNNKIGK